MATKTKTNRMVYKVVPVKQFKGKPYIGQIDYSKKTITLAMFGGISGRALTSVEVLQAYYHEIVHAVLHDMKHPLNNNEKFVDAFAQRLRWYAKGVGEEMTKDKKDAADLVAQRFKGLRKLRKEVPRSKSAKKVQAK